jgi:outer membrane protein
MKIIKFFFAAILFSGAAYAQDKIAHVDSDSVLRSMDEYKIQIKQLETYQKQLAAQSEKMQSDFKTKYEDLQRTEKDLAPIILEEKYKELQQMEQNIIQFNQKAQGDIIKKEKDLLEPLINKVKKAIQEVAKAKGYSYVAPSENFLYADPIHDITLEVIKKVLQK